MQFSHFYLHLLNCGNLHVKNWICALRCTGINVFGGELLVKGIREQMAMIHWFFLMMLDFSLYSNSTVVEFMFWGSGIAQ